MKERMINNLCNTTLEIGGCIEWAGEVRRSGSALDFLRDQAMSCHTRFSSEAVPDLLLRNPSRLTDNPIIFIAHSHWYYQEKQMMANRRT